MTNAYKDLGGAGLEDEEFLDILEERRQSSDLGFAFRTFNPSPYNAVPPSSTAELNRAVLESQYLRYMVKEIATETGSSVEQVREEACGILNEMSQNLQLGFIRLMSYTLSKVFKRLFSSIFVNMEGLNMLQQAAQECPVILMPNHRSYVDFLVISYILYSYDIPIPVIAAGIPLAGMKIVGEILRRSGAFFIRRAIGSDKLYWAVLSEYVRMIVRRGFAPLEFYVEGFRSRTLKSLIPKFGMMHMVLEPFFKGEVYDIALVPISISYERVLEESLLAHELLGVPKPRESTMGLLKASRVLKDNYGCMHVNFGRPLSVRQLCEGKINRGQYNLIPRDLPQKPTAEAQACVSWLAHLIVRVQEEGSLISPWSLMASLLLQVPATVLAQEGLLWDQLTERILWLRKLVLDFGGRLNWPEGVPESEVMSSTAALHRSVVRCRAGRVHLVEEDQPERKHPGSPEEAVMRTASAALMLASYRNQALHVFVRPALLATAMRLTKSRQKGELLSLFCFLQDVFSNEFIFIPDRSSQDFEEACCLLRKCGAVCISEEELTVSDTGVEVLSFLQELMKPFIDSYQLMLRYLCEEGDPVFSEKEFLPAVRNLATKLILSGELHTYEALSSDTQKNVLAALRRMEALTKLNSDSKYRVNKVAVRRSEEILSGKIPPQNLQATPDARL
ncbi:dihydroxyacetone phosphate acyltransferase [Menidia menidia]